jgi:hypothetical protein
MPDAPYAAELAKLKAGNPTREPKRWEQACRDAQAFLARWGEESRALGWTGRDLFSLHPLAPLSRYDEMGLVWTLGGEDVSELTAEYARTGNTRYFRSRPDGSPK